MIARTFLVCLSVLAASVLAHAAPLTVRVDPAGGAPRLVVNGEPVRARMFWGGPGSAPLPVAPEWKEVRFEFTARHTTSNGTMHFRFGPTEGEIILDDIQVTDLDAYRDIVPRCDFENGPTSFKREWTFWPTDATNTLARIEVEPGVGRDSSRALRVQLVKPANGHWPDFHIYHHANLALTKGHHYRVSFWARSTPARSLIVAFYQPGQSFINIGGPSDVFENQIKLAAEAGVDFVSFPVGLPWPKPGVAVDWSGVDEACETVLRANPKALLLPRIGMDPPAWWREAHPDDVMQWEDGSRSHGVPASPAYRRDAAERLAAEVAHLEEKFGDHVAGYHPCGQNTGEWFYEGTWKRPLNGYAPADLAAWRLWLRKRYDDDAALRRAWNDPAVTCETAAVPTPAARHAAPAGIFRDPATERALLDWAGFQQEAMADCVCQLAHAVRTASHGRKLVVFFYGYLFEFAPVQNGPATSGHYALRRALDCPDIDVLCSPISYFDRGLAQSAPAMTAAESVALARKMWLYEDDTRTYLGTGRAPGWQDAVSTLEDTNRELVRNVAQEAMRNFGTWWMDLLVTGWFNDPGMWAEMKRVRGLDEAFLKKPTPFRPDVAAVIDENVMMRVAAGGSLVTRPGVYEVRAPLGRMGAPYGQYLIDDVLRGRVRAKMVVFLDAWRLTRDERIRLRRTARPAARVWCYAPGWFDGERESLEAMQQLTGFEFKKVTPDKAWATPTELGKKLGLEKSFGVEKPVKPLFAVTDAARDEILACYPDGSVAVAMRRTPDGPDIFVGAPGLTSELLRLVAREADVHLFTEVDCNVYANGHYVAVHASQEGPLWLNVKGSGAVKDMLSGETVGHGPRILLPLKRGDTRVFGY